MATIVYTDWTSIELARCQDELAKCRAVLAKAYMRDGWRNGAFEEVARLAKLLVAEAVPKSYEAFTLERIIAEVERPLPGEMR